ncbi:MAG TPA: SRPBCC family protein [Candidatus Limnocylindrales bacterium]|nr:SRPBCC family protein [Candidatus Limnocylindrales bacterium]
MRSDISVRIAAPPALVFALTRDVERWAVLLPHYGRSQVVTRGPDGRLVISFVARRPLIGVLGLGLPVAWRARTWNEPAERRLRFRHVAGVTRGMDVTWRIESTDDGSGSLVTIEHDFRPRLPGLAPFVDRWFTRPIAGRTLATFRALAEAIAKDRSESGASRSTKGRP